MARTFPDRIRPAAVDTLGGPRRRSPVVSEQTPDDGAPLGDGSRSGVRWEDVLGHVVCADNLGLMRSLPDERIDLIYADPPYGPTPSHTDRHRAEVRGAAGKRRESDALGRYLAALEPRLREMHRLLSHNGSLLVHLDWRAVHHVKVLLDGIFGPRQFLNEIVWVYRSGGRDGRWFRRKHDTLLWYARHAGRHTFEPMRGEPYRTKDMCYREDGTPFKRTRNGPILFHPEGGTLGDVWDIPMLSTVALERTGYPGQKPRTLLERVIRCCSRTGDTVADFFCGSGTTLVVAQQMDRRWIGCDSDPRAVEIALRRLAHASSHEGAPNAPGGAGASASRSGSPRGRLGRSVRDGRGEGER
jgi:site-specific DNA-methyltransferase (adenine-specific)